MAKISTKTEAIKLLSKIKKAKKTLKIAALSLVFLIILLLLGTGTYSALYSKKAFSRQYIGEINFGGLKKSEVTTKIDEKITAFYEKNITLSYKEEGKDKEYSIKSSDIELAYNSEKTLDTIWQYGRTGNVWKSFWEQFTSIFVKKSHSFSYSINNDKLVEVIAKIAEEVDVPEKDYLIKYGKEEKFVLETDRQEGKRIDKTKLTQIVISNLNNANPNPIEFRSETFKPQIKESNAQERLIEANRILESGELVLVYDNTEYKIDLDTIGGLIKSEQVGDDLKIICEDERVNSYVATLAKSIDLEPENAVLSISNGSAVVFKFSRAGKKLDQDSTVSSIKSKLLERSRNSNTDKIELKIQTTDPEITDDQIGNYGIKELVGTATTSFTGSPSNRVHNIQVGANAINGALIKPGETFSTLARLGKIDATTGYLEELVIKENRTVPEFGGGLCQVSSTLFRSALNAGLKIDERRNHKYRVSYYEPPVGMDATIYDPAPDFRFTNNYSSYLLVQAKVEGTKIKFDIYGTKDDRKIEQSTPEIYDITTPGEPLMIETDTLAPGEKKLIEKPHNGASAKFSYKVTRGGELLQETIFYSKYVAWQERWLVGKQPAPAPETPAPTPTETPAPTSSPASTPVQTPVSATPAPSSTP